MSETINQLQINNTPSSSSIITIVDNNVNYQFNLSGITGNSINTSQLYLSSNPNNFSSSGNVQNTGTVLQNQLFGLSGQLNLTGNNISTAIINLSGNIINTGAILYNDIEQLSGVLIQSGSNLNGYGYIQTNTVIVNLNSVFSGSCIGTPNFGSNIIPISGFLPGDVYMGEFSYACMQLNEGLFGQVLYLQIQNNLISGVYGSQSPAMYEYKILCLSPTQLFVCPAISPQPAGVQFYFTNMGNTEFTPPLIPQIITINPSQPCNVNLLVTIPSLNITSGIMYYSFLKKIS